MRSADCRPVCGRAVTMLSILTARTRPSFLTGSPVNGATSWVGRGTVGGGGGGGRGGERRARQRLRLDRGGRSAEGKDKRDGDGRGDDGAPATEDQPRM